MLYGPTYETRRRLWVIKLYLWSLHRTTQAKSRYAALGRCYWKHLRKATELLSAAAVWWCGMGAKGGIEEKNVSKGTSSALKRKMLGFFFAGFN